MWFGDPFLDLQKCKGPRPSQRQVWQGEEGLKTMQTLGQNMAWPLKRVNT